MARGYSWQQGEARIHEEPDCLTCIPETLGGPGESHGVIVAGVTAVGDVGGSTVTQGGGGWLYLLSAPFHRAAN